MPATDDDGPAVRVVPRASRRWMSPGGEDDDESMTIWIIAGAEKQRRYTIRLPLHVNDEAELTMGEPEVSELLS